MKKPTSRKGATGSGGSTSSRGTAPKSPGRTSDSSPVTRAAKRSSGKIRREEEVRSTGGAAADELEGEAAEEAEELELEDLSDDEEPELPAVTPIPEEEESEW